MNTQLNITTLTVEEANMISGGHKGQDDAFGQVATAASKMTKQEWKDLGNSIKNFLVGSNEKRKEGARCGMRGKGTMKNGKCKLH